MATTIDKNKPVWRVVGRIAEPDGRRMTCFVNASSEAEAETLGRAEGIAHLEACQYIPPERIAEWESRTVRYREKHMGEEIMNKEFQVHALNEKVKANAIAAAFDGLLDKLLEINPEPSREMLLVRTKLEEASFFAKKAMAVKPENTGVGDVDEKVVPLRKWCPQCFTPLTETGEAIVREGHRAVHEMMACRDAIKKLYLQERDAKRRLAEQLLDLVQIGMSVALLQPAAYAKDQAEADKWARFYKALNEAPVSGTIIDGMRTAFRNGGNG